MRSFNPLPAVLRKNPRAEASLALLESVEYAVILDRFSILLSLSFVLNKRDTHMLLLARTPMWSRVSASVAVALFESDIETCNAVVGVDVPIPTLLRDALT